MRAFIAIELSKEIKDYLYGLQKEFKELGKIKFVDKRNLHLTLRFLGEIDEEQLEKIKEKLKEIKFKPFELKLDRMGVFPDEGFIRIIWIGLGPEKNIFELERKIDEGLIDLSSRDQEFKAHLTLGRVKFIIDKKKFIEKLKRIKIKELIFMVDRFKLIKSELTKDGPRYEVLEEYILD